MSQPRYPVPQPLPAVGPPSVYLRLTAQGPAPNRFFVRAPREQPEIEVGRPRVYLRLAPQPPAPTLFLVRAPRGQPDEVLGRPLVLARLAVAPAVPTFFLIRAPPDQPPDTVIRPVVLARLAVAVAVPLPVVRGVGQPDIDLRAPAIVGRLPTARISGVTRDCATNAPIGSCIVHLFRTSDDAKIGSTVSDVNGQYSFSVLLDGTQYYLVAYLAGSPDLAGTTVNTIVAA